MRLDKTKITTSPFNFDQGTADFRQWTNCFTEAWWAPHGPMLVTVSSLNEPSAMQSILNQVDMVLYRQPLSIVSANKDFEDVNNHTHQSPWWNQHHLVKNLKGDCRGSVNQNSKRPLDSVSVLFITVRRPVTDFTLLQSWPETWEGRHHPQRNNNVFQRHGELHMGPCQSLPPSSLSDESPTRVHQVYWVSASQTSQRYLVPED